MRRLLMTLAATATTALIPMLALADNQQVAEQIAANLRNSGQLQGYKIGVKYQDGTAWLRGRVTSEEQMRIALRLASEVPGVRQVENELAVAASEAAPTSPLGKLVNPFAGSPVRPASADMPVQPLQQGAGAMAPEQFPRTMASTMGAAHPRPVARASAPESGPVLMGPERAYPVPTSFPASRAVTAGAEEPTLAPPAPQPIPMARPQEMVPQPMAVPAARAAAPRPVPIALAQGNAGAPVPAQPMAGSPVPAYGAPASGGVAPVRYDQAHMPNYAWPSYAAYPNYAAVTYPKQYSPTAWPYIGPFYPYPQVPLGWRKVSLEWHDGWWFLDFDDGAASKPFAGLFRCK